MFVHQSKLATAVTGTVYGNDLDVLRQAVEAAIKAHHGRPYDMTVSLSQHSALLHIKAQL